MKICVLAHLFPARSETFVREHVIGLARRGHDVTVIAREVGDGISAAELASLEAAGVRYVYVGNLHSRLVVFSRGATSLLRTPGLARVLWRPAPWTRKALVLASRYVQEIARFEPDVVHIHFGSLAARVQCVVQAQQAFTPTVVTWHGYEATVLPRILRPDLYLPLFSSDWRQTVGSSYMRKRLQSLGAIETHVDLIPMGIDLNTFTYLERPQRSGAELKVLSVGRLDEMKGHGYLIDAMSALVRSGTRVSLQIVGDGPLKSSYSQKIHEENLEEYIHLLGSADSHRVLEEMHKADVFALTGVEAQNGRVETQGVVFAEAQATGLPVIASNVGGVPESVRNGVTGFLCEPRNIEEIASAITFFAENRDQIREFGRNGRAFVEKTFQNETMIDRFEKLYLNIQTL